MTEEYPQGAFLRPTVTGRGKEESPFTSMALSLYWVVVTVTSVGYGEDIMSPDEKSSCHFLLVVLRDVIEDALSLLSGRVCHDASCRTLSLFRMILACAQVNSCARLRMVA